MKYITIERKRAMAIYNPKSLKAEEFINDGEIRATLEYAEANKNNRELILSIIESKQQNYAI